MTNKWPDRYGWDKLDYMVTVFAEACGAEAVVKEKDGYLTFRIIGLKKLPYGQQNAFHILRELFEDAGEQHTLDEISEHIAAAKNGYP